MKLQFRQIEPFLQKPDPAALCILVYGPDEGLVRERADMLTRHIVSDIKDPFSVTELSSDQLKNNPALLIDEAQSISMFGGRKVVRVRASSEDDLRPMEGAVNNALKSLKENDNLVIIEAGNLGAQSGVRKACEAAKNAVALPCYVEEERDLTKVISMALKEQGYAIESDALVYMAANVVGDRAVVRGETEKLITYMGQDNKRVRLEDVTACIGDSADLSIDILAKSVASGRYGEAERILKYLLHEGTAFVLVTRNLQNYFLRLHITKARMEGGENIEMAMKKLRPEVFWKHKDAFIAQVSSWSLLQLEQALGLILSAEAKCKQTGADPELLLSRALLALSQIGGKALARRRA